MIPTEARQPFFKRGRIVDGCGTADEAMKLADLDYSVAKVAVIAEKVKKVNGVLTDVNGNTYPDMKSVPDALKNSYVNNTYAILRTDTGQILTTPGKTVTKQYTCVQNATAFDLMDSVIGEGEALFQTAGSFGRGEEVFLTAKFPSYTRAISGDEINDYVVMKLSHDGSGGVVVFMSPIRVVCENTLHLALKGAESKVMFKHTINVHQKLNNLAELLKVHTNYSEKLMYDFEVLKRKQVDYTKVLTYLNDFMVTPAEKASIKLAGNTLEIVNSRKANLITDLVSTIESGVGQNYHQGTALWMLNGISTYYNNNEFKSDQAKFESLYNGNAKSKVQVAFDYLLTV